MRRNERLRVALLCGGQTQGWPEDFDSSLQFVAGTMVVAPRLAYDTPPVDESSQLAGQLRGLLAALRFTPDETVVHVHNHSLGKNASLPGAVHALAADGFALLLQIHDFAEDYRPRNYCHLADAWNGYEISARLYPQAAHIHYAVINRRDYAVLCAGRCAGRPAAPSPECPRAARPNAGSRFCPPRNVRSEFGVPTTERFLLYPVRAIRRKNLGEALFWSVLGGPGVHVGVTLAPLNPAEQPYYRRWQQVAREMQLNGHFEMGGTRGLPLDENLASADLTLTTSVSEGFGMAFLESWAAERGAGRSRPAGDHR